MSLNDVQHCFLLSCLCVLCGASAGSEQFRRPGEPGYTATGVPFGPGMVASCGTPRAWKIVATSSCGVTGRSVGSVPFASVRPMTRPPFAPPPATSAVQHPAQWSRPPLAFSCGVRPNSPVATTSVDVEQAAVFEVGEQRRERGVERRGDGVADVVQVGAERPAVRVAVPRRGVEDGGELVDGDEPDAVADGTARRSLQANSKLAT